MALPIIRRAHEFDPVRSRIELRGARLLKFAGGGSEMAQQSNRRFGNLLQKMA
jgi:hypothetical protein